MFFRRDRISWGQQLKSILLPNFHSIISEEHSGVVNPSKPDSRNAECTLFRESLWKN